MRIVKVMALAMCLLLIGTGKASAATIEEVYREQWEASGAETLPDSLPEETKKLLDSLNITSLDSTSITNLSADSVMNIVLKLLSAVAREPLQACGTVLGITVLYAWMQGLKNTLYTEESATVFAVVCALAVCGTVMFPISSCLQRVCEAMNSVSVFMTAFAPVYAGVLLGGGSTVGALSFQSIVLYSAELLSYVSGAVVLPLLTVALALGLTGSLTPEMRLGRVGDFIGKTAAWVLALGMLLFTGLLSLQSLAGSAADRLGDRVLKFSISSFVPVVGSSLSEAFSTVRGCLGLLRSTVGGFGVLATALIVLPPLLTCFVWQVSLSLCNIAAEMFELPALSGILQSARGVTKSLIGLLAASGLLLIISITVVTVATGGAV